MINDILHLLMVATSSSTIIVLLLISLRNKLKQWIGAAGNYYLWFIVFVPWLTIFIPINLYKHSQTIKIYSDKIAMKFPIDVSVNHWFSVANCAFLVWVMGVVLAALYLCCNHLLFVKKLKKDACKLSELEEDALLYLLNKEDVKYIKKIYLTDLVVSPMLCHIFNSKIYLPREFFQNYSLQERKMVLLHEIQHDKRHDLLANTAFLFLICLNWFNPILYFAYRHFRSSQEMACDYRITYQFSTEEKQTYGNALLKTVMREITQTTSMNCLLNSGMQIKERFLMLKFQQSKYSNLYTNMILSMALMLAFLAPHLDQFVAQVMVPKMRLFSSNRLVRNEKEDMFMGHVQLLLSNNIRIFASNVAVQYTDATHRIVAKYIIEGPGVILKNNKVVSFKYGVFDPASMQFSGSIKNNFK